MFKPPEINWTHPLIGCNPFMMGMANMMAIQKTLMEAHQKKMIEFMTTGVFK